MRDLKVWGTTAILLLLVTMLAQSAIAQCTTGIANTNTGVAIRSMGFRVIGEDTVMCRAGNSFVLDCDAHLQTLTAVVRLAGYVSNGIQPLVAGDLLLCEVFDGDKNLIMSEVEAIPEVLGDIPIAYDFSDRQFRLAAGTYYYLLSPLERLWGHLRLGAEYADGAYQQEFEFYGTWGDLTGDAMFDIDWDPDSVLVGAEHDAWGNVKALYR